MLQFGAYQLTAMLSDPHKTAEKYGLKYVERHNKQFLLEPGDDPQAHDTYNNAKAASILPGEKLMTVSGSDGNLKRLVLEA